MPGANDALMAAIHANEARRFGGQWFIGKDAQAVTRVEAAAAAEAYFKDVVRPILAKVQADVMAAGQPLQYHPGFPVRMGYGMRIQETILTPWYSADGDTYAAHVQIYALGGNSILVIGGTDNQARGPSERKRGFLKVGAPASEVDQLIRNCLIAILNDS